MMFTYIVSDNYIYFDESNASYNVIVSNKYNRINWEEQKLNCLYDINRMV